MPTPSLFLLQRHFSPRAFAGCLLAIGIAFGVLGTPWTAPADPPDMGDLEKDKAPLAHLRLMNGDRIHGRMDGIATRDEGLAWRHPAVPASPILFRLDHIDGITFTEPRTAGLEGGEGELMAQVLLHNGDHLAGRLVEVSAEAVDLETDFGERLRIRRSAVAEIGVGRGGVRSYRGPVPGETWLAVQNLPVPESGPDGLVFRTASAAAIRVPSLPESVRLDFDLQWRGQQHFAVLLFLEDTSRMHGNALWFRIHSGRILQVMRTTTNRRGSSQIGQADISAAAPGADETWRFSIMADRPNGRIAVMVNDRTVLEGTDAELSGLGGEMIAFHNQHAQSQIRLRNIEVRPWSGPLSPNQAPAGEGGDAIRFVNGDAVAGELQGIAEGHVQFASSVGDLRIPLDRVQSVRLPGAAPDPAPAVAGHIRVTLAPYGLLTVAMARMGVEDGLQAHGEAFGDVRIPLVALRRVEFNLGREREGSEAW